MASNKTTKSTKSTNKKQVVNKDTSSEENNSSDEDVSVKSKSSISKKMTSVKVEQQDNDSESNSDNQKKSKVKKSKGITGKKMAFVKVEQLDDDSEEVNNNSDKNPDSDSESKSESESESENHKKSKEKKHKESFDELTKKLDELQINIKTIDKEILESEKVLITKKKMRNDYERQRNTIFKLYPKTHNDEIIKARKDKPKRKSNPTGGFCSEQPVPDLLVKFLDLAPGATMRRPKVASVMSNKFKELHLKEGQNTILDKATIEALELDPSYDGKVITFNEFQTFLKSFYPTKVEKNTVVI
jgi:hypothetical protein